MTLSLPIAEATNVFCYTDIPIEPRQKPSMLFKKKKINPVYIVYYLETYI